jgi:CHAT domain-containing protein/tetratricopeptide (TPR) repeat protein
MLLNAGNVNGDNGSVGAVLRTLTRSQRSPAQSVTGGGEPGHAATIREDEAKLRGVVTEYFDALRKKDWQRLDVIGVQRYGEMMISGSDSHGPSLTYNTSLELTKRLLAPYMIQALSFTIDKVEIKGRQAIVRAKISMKVCEADTGVTVIDFENLERVLHLDKYPSSWKVNLDEESDRPLANQIKKAGHPVERQFLLCQENPLNLLSAKAELKREGIRLLERGRLEQAFAEFDLAQEIVLHLRERASVSARLRLKRREEDALAGRTLGRQKDLALNLLWAGQEQAELKEFGKAEEYFVESIKLLEGLGDRENLAKAYMETAAVQLELGKYPQAISSYEHSIDKYILIAAVQKGESSYAASKVIEAVIAVAFLYAAQGKYDQVEEFILRNSKRVENVGLTGDAIGLLYIIPLLEMTRGEAVRAAENMEKLLLRLNQAGSKIEDGKEIDASLRLMAVMLYSLQGKFVVAAQHLEKIRTVEIKQDEAVAWSHLLQFMDGMLYGAYGNEEQVPFRIKRVLPEMMNTGLGEHDIPDILMIWSLAHISKTIFSPGADEGSLPQEVFNSALQSLQFSATMAEKAGNMIQAARAHQMIAGLYTNQNHLKEIEHYLKGLSFLEGTAIPFKEKYFAQPVADNLLLNLGGTYMALGNYTDAIGTYQKILSQNGPRVFRIYEQGIYMGIAESYYSLKEFDEAIKYALEAVRVARLSNDRETMKDAYLLTGNAYLALGRPQAARQNYQSAIDEVEAARSQIAGSEPSAAQFFEDKIIPYQSMTRLLILQGDIDGALSYVERSKSKVLLEVLKNGRKNTASLMTPQERKQWHDLRRRLMLLNSQVIRAQASPVSAAEMRLLRNRRVEARLDYELFQARLYVKHPELMESPDADQSWFKVADAARLLASPDEAALEFMVTKKKTYLFVLTRKGHASSDPGTQTAKPEVECKVYEIGIEDHELLNLINSFRVRISHSEGVIGHRARELYDLLLGQAQEQLVGKKSLIIIPDGVLWNLPFQALMPTDARYLLEDFAVSYAPSLSALREMRKVREERILQNKPVAGRQGAPPARFTVPAPSLLAIGDPGGCTPTSTGCDDGLPHLARTFKPLPGSGRLAKRLRRFYGPGKSRSYSGRRASEATMKREMPGHQVIHIGTHGVIDNDNPMYSFLLLYAAPARGNDSRVEEEYVGTEDGFLEAWELMDLNLKAEMIVLSSCDTARGKVRNGEGIVGFSWAALIAGSPTAVVGQWEVDETSTNEMMYDFHKRWVKDRKSNPAQVNVSVALQQSALTLLRGKKYSHPYYWAGFAVVGVGH